jgi:hypothetical protein
MHNLRFMSDGVQILSFQQKPTLHEDFSVLILCFVLCTYWSHCATSLKVVGSRLDEVNDFYQVT